MRFGQFGLGFRVHLGLTPFLTGVFLIIVIVQQLTPARFSTKEDTCVISYVAEFVTGLRLEHGRATVPNSIMLLQSHGLGFGVLGFRV